jgi:RNA recognition motif-containing protein
LDLSEMTKLYVGNLPYSVNDAELRSIFEAHGTVDSASIIIDRETGRPRGFGFVEMSSSEQANAAIAALNGTQMGGRALVVNEAKPREERPRGGGGGWGGGGGGRGGYGGGGGRGGGDRGGRSGGW